MDNRALARQTARLPESRRPSTRRLDAADPACLALRAKRVLDIVLASLLIVLTAPVFLVAVTAVRLTSGGGVIFRQRRVGRYGDEFIMFKFRTMYPEAPELEDALAEAGDRIFLKVQGDVRVTPVGRLLRKFSIDELPQLFNVLRGDMALVGPRPLLPADMRRFPRGDVHRRFHMPPGLTGLWQVNGRSLCTDAERLHLDLEYVDRWSLWMDLLILFRTPAAVLLAKGAF